MTVNTSVSNKNADEAMISKQRFLAAFNGEEVDRSCAARITSVVNFELMNLVGSHFPEANTDRIRWRNLPQAGMTCWVLTA